MPFRPGRWNCEVASFWCHWLPQGQPLRHVGRKALNTIGDSPARCIGTTRTEPLAWVRANLPRRALSSWHASIQACRDLSGRGGAAPFFDAIGRATAPPGDNHPLVAPWAPSANCCTAGDKLAAPLHPIGRPLTPLLTHQRQRAPIAAVAIRELGVRRPRPLRPGVLPSAAKTVRCPTLHGPPPRRVSTHLEAARKM